MITQRHCWHKVSMDQKAQNTTPYLLSLVSTNGKKRSPPCFAGSIFVFCVLSDENAFVVLLAQAFTYLQIR